MNNFIALLQVLFIGLKITGYVTWSWWLVLLPVCVIIVLYILLFITKSLATSDWLLNYQIKRAMNQVAEEIKTERRERLS